MKTFIFETLDDSEIESKEYKGLKQALFDIQKQIKGNLVHVQYTNKKGNAIDRWIKIPSWSLILSLALESGCSAAFMAVINNSLEGVPS